jgi:hypothetical protein
MKDRISKLAKARKTKEMIKPAIIASIIVLLACAVAYSVISVPGPEIPILPGASIIDWPLHDVQAEALVVKRVVMKAHGGSFELEQAYEEQLRNHGWSGSYLPRNCDYGGPGPLIWHHPGSPPWNAQWPATISAYDMGDNTVYIEFTVWSSYRVPAGANPCS